MSGRVRNNPSAALKERVQALWSQRSTSLSRRIFFTMLIFSCVVMLAISLVVTTLFYFSYENEAEQTLVDRAHNTAAYMNEVAEVSAESGAAESEDDVVNEESITQEAIAALVSGFSDEVRYTLVAADGTVLFDSTFALERLGNHLDRPEISEALISGESSVHRYSASLDTDTIYAAVLLNDGSVIRLSESRASFLAFASSLVGPLLIALAVIICMVFVISRLLVYRIIAPIDSLDLSDPSANEVYEEMDPLLARIDDQQRQLVRQMDELRRAETMRRDFTANVSHEIKTPLQVISGYAELMKGGLVDEQDTAKFAGLIYDEAQTMRTLIDDVLVLSRLDESAAGERNQVVDLHAIALQVAARLAPFADAEGVRVAVEGSKECIKGVPSLIEEMFYNLVENGIRYNCAGGSVQVMVSDDGVGPVVTVADTGIGIAEEAREKVFERFFRVEKSRSKETGGTGLGLAIVKHVVSYHGGTIELRSALGEGSTFIVRFPSSPELAQL